MPSFSQTSLDAVVAPKPSEVVVAERDDLGRFKPGASGNPAGKPKGATSIITQMKRDMEQLLREDMHDEMQEVMRKGIALAKSGNTAMIKLFMEMNISKNTPDDNKQVEKVEIKIGRVDNLPMDLTTNVTAEAVGESKEDEDAETDSRRGAGEEGSEPEPPPVA